MMRDTEKELEKKRKKNGGSKWEKIGENENKKICPFDDKKVCPVTISYCRDRRPRLSVIRENYPLEFLRADFSL